MIKSSLAFPFFLFMVFLYSHTASGGERNIGFGGEIGYCVANRKDAGLPELVNGGALGLHLMYAFNDTWGLSLEGNFDWYPPYQTYVLDEVSSETSDGTETVVGWVHGPWIGRSFLTTATLSVIYIVDVMRIQPYLAAGITGSHSSLQSGSHFYKGSDLGVRLSVGADYMFSQISGAGLLLNNDISLLGDSAFSSRVAIMVRFIYFFSAKNFVKRHAKS